MYTYTPCIPLFLGTGNLGRYPLPLITNSEVPRERSTAPVSRLPCLSPVSSWCSLAFYQDAGASLDSSLGNLEDPVVDTLRASHPWTDLGGSTPYIISISRCTEYYSILKLLFACTRGRVPRVVWRVDGFASCLVRCKGVHSCTLYVISLYLTQLEHAYGVFIMDSAPF